MRVLKVRGLLVFLAVLVIALFAFGTSWAKDKDNNPPGPKGGPGTNWENPPGAAGGPGVSPDKKIPPPDKRPPKKEFCRNHPNDPKCTGEGRFGATPAIPAGPGLQPATPATPPNKHAKFCRQHPWHKKCQAGYNPPGPRGGPGAGDVDNNPPGPKGGPGTNWENPKGPAGGPGASPDKKPPRKHKRK